MKKHCRRVFTGVVGLLFVTFWGIATGYCQSAAKNPADYAYDLAQHLHDANGNYCAKPLSIKEARWLTQYYAAHKNDPLGEQSVVLSDSEVETAKSMSKGKCEQPAGGPTTTGSSNTAKSPQIPVPAPTATKAAIAAVEKPHGIRIGVAAPDTQIGQSNGMGSVSDPIRSMLIQYLNGPGLEIVPITAMLPIQIEAEAKEKACEYVLYSSVTQKKSGGMGFLKAATLASSFTPIGAMAGATRAATAAAGAATAAQAATVSSAVKAKTEYTLAYKLVTPGNPTPVLTNSATAKAKNDGDDVITPLIQQAATAILGQVTTKK